MKLWRALLVAALLLGISAQAFAASSHATGTSAQSAVLLEASTNTIMFSKAAHEKLPMASTTKVMTALVAIENGDLDEMVTANDAAYGVEGSSIYLYRNERISLRDLLYGLLLRSGNDAAVAIACHIAGSVDEFAKMMNAKAKELGAVNTNFVNPHGLPNDDHYTTAYDLALICSAALKNDTFKEISGAQYYKSSSGQVERTMMNKNKLLWEYDGACGIKTGYTTAAGKCLTFAAERDGMLVVGVILNCPNMFPDAKVLMDYAFAAYEMYTVIEKDTAIARVQADGAPGGILTLCAAASLSVPVEKSVGLQVVPRVTYYYDKINVPIFKGDVLGCLELYADGRLITHCDLVADRDVYSPTFWYFLNRVVKSLNG